VPSTGPIPLGGSGAGGAGTSAAGPVCGLVKTGGAGQNVRVTGNGQKVLRATENG